MPALHNPKHEMFAQAVASGVSPTKAYEMAGYAPSAANAAKVKGYERVKLRIAELVEQRAEKYGRMVERGAEIAVQRTAISKELVFNEFGCLGFSNMLDYMRLQPDGSAVFDWSKLTRDQAAAIVEVTVEEFMDGKGDNARPVRRIKFKLADKIAALTKIGQELGMFVEKHKVEHSLEHRLANMTEEQKREDIEDTINTIKRLVGRAPAPDEPPAVTIDVEPEEPQGE